MNDLKVFSGRANITLAKRICEYLALPLGAMMVTDFPDGETHCKIEQDVRGQDIFVVQPTCPPVNDNLMELLIMIESLKRASAERVTAVIPYFGYARQDRKDEGRVPITAKLVANILTRAGADRILTIDLHAAQIQGFFDIPVDHLSAGPVLDDYFRRLLPASEELVVVSPDEGSIKRASAHAKILNASLAIIDKRRFGNRVEQANIIGCPLEGKTALLFDDMISTAGSISGAAHLAKRHGAAKIFIAATHGVLCGNAVELLRQTPADSIILTDSIPQSDDILPNVHILSIAPLLGEAIRRIHCHESVSRLFREILSWTGR
ncbi:MAG: ribose-phosphate diphosphokinase [Thermoguttaceae bacterium]